MNVNRYYVAQFNTARMRPQKIDDPTMAGFVSQLDRINALADAAPGFVWRLQTEDGNSIGIRPYSDERILITFSVWESIEALFQFTYQSQHAEVMRDRKQWFEHLEGMYIVLWWIPAGYIPTIDEAKERLEYLQNHGPTPRAFTFDTRFPMPEIEPMIAQ